jgi:hypothetical protein
MPSSISENHMMSNKNTDQLLYGLLKKRGIASAWADRESPRNDLAVECTVLMTDRTFSADLRDYLLKNPVITESMETVLAQLAFSAGVDWRHAEKILLPLAQRGWHLSRWLPTFLLIDGPLGRLLRQQQSPLAKKLKTDSKNFPMLCSSRDAFNNDLFRKVRNGFAHWSFSWTNLESEAKISLFHYETGTKEAEVTQLEAEALHYLSASVIQTINQELLRKISANAGY